ncbi:hypothetical protein BG015_002733, partial [Linnemannia schmuckeri]
PISTPPSTTQKDEPDTPPSIQNMETGRRHKDHVLRYKAQIFMAQPVGEEDKVVVRYMWKHNHDDDRAQSPLARNKREMGYQKDKDVVKSVKLWFKEIENKGGKTMFVEDATVTGFAYGWFTKFQLKVISENTNIHCMDSTHKTAKDAAPIEERSKIHNSVYLFTLLVKDKDVQQGIPVAFMACKSESRYPIIRWLD